MGREQQTWTSIAAAACGAAAGSLLGTCWLLFEFLTETLQSVDSVLFTLWLVGPPFLCGSIAAGILRLLDGTSNRRLLALTAALTALVAGIVTGSWWFSRLTDG